MRPPIDSHLPAASKEWVIPAKPKPGRKPKKEAVAPVVVDSEVRGHHAESHCGPSLTTAVTPIDRLEGQTCPEQVSRAHFRSFLLVLTPSFVARRAAQRAFRERKQLQLADLQARVQQYEQGEIERTVAIQSLAKRLKEENDKLKAENACLKDRIAQLEQERDGQGADAHRKRWRDADPSENVSSKRPKISLLSQSLSHLSAREPASYLSSPSSNVSTTDSGDSYPPFSPISLNTSPIDHVASVGPGSPFGDLPPIQPSWRSSVFDTEVTPSQRLDCRFCSVTDGTCVCAELALQHVSSSLSSPLKLENVDLSLMESNSRLEDRMSTSGGLSILDNLPPYQPAVPLRRRSAQPPAAIGSTSSSVFPVWIPAASPDTSPTCSGDPSNCMACADDDFGKAFCAAINASVSTSAPRCDTCLDVTKSASPSRTLSPTAPEYISSNAGRNVQSPDLAERLPTNEAWRQLKSHPNVAFADLRLLAEVVARRHKCTGPTVEIVPAPGSITPERATGSPVPFGSEDNQSIVLTDPHAHYHEEQARRTAPPEVVVKCGCQDVREVPADGVRDALRLLDGPFGPHT